MSQMTLDRLRNELHPIVTLIHTFERVDRTYLAFLVREAAFSKQARPRLWVQYMSFVACPKSHLNPRIIEVENGFRIADEVAPPPRDRKGTHVLSILVHGATSHWPYECNCLETAFTIQALQMVESCWVVDPSSVDGMTQGMDDHYGRCGWGDSGGLAIWTNTLKLPNRAPTLDHLFAHDGSFQQWRNQAAKYDPQATTPDLFISAAEISEMKEAVERAPTPSKKTSNRLERSGGTLYYALALIKHVSEQEQPEARIGCLGAFAHQWPCQVELDPQLFPNKFGCTDGEGVQVSLTAG
ncbi:BQ5605_C001g00415 [Microbotryum silenes-dioicae]|uniref:BQ5605_C001g00415 protein n=1 Tax=Microbotryum silenes-dioicae TaxID=796604 RepID=A0A2X0P5S8_9BASI|nr:BQ5605_C001g00415 [Microbotryum silenes-dioicae]